MSQRQAVTDLGNHGQARKERLGHDNRWTLQAEMLLGKLMLAVFRLNEALPLLEDTLERQIKLL